MSANDADGMANNVDPDQTALLGAVWSRSALFAQAILSENLESLGYYCLITGLLVLWGHNYGIQYLVKNAWALENLPRFRGCTPPPTLPLCIDLPSS